MSNVEEIDLHPYSSMGVVETPVEKESLGVEVIQTEIALGWDAKKEPLLDLKDKAEMEFPIEQQLSSYSLPPSLEKKEKTGSQDKLLVQNGFPSLEKYELPHVKESASWNKDFDMTLQLLPDEENGGYFFAISLKAAGDLKEHALAQHIHFIVDRSSSVKKHRFAIFKRAVSKALSSLQPGDTFNIYMVDKKVAKFSSHMLFATAKNIRSAEAFLDKQQAGTLFSTSDIYTSLNKIFPDIQDSEQVDTAIVLTKIFHSLSRL
ncbi:MAG: hypothetical protein HYZ48_03765 [Chlamydiales bacterium]|nr:hypothetical protein [Chlamydiales bacterium]